VPVNWYDDEVMLVVQGASDELLTAIALQVEGSAKIKITDNGQVDTGFMRNAVYAIAPDRNNRPKARMEAHAVAKRPFAPKPRVDRHSAGVHAAAEYSIYQEIAQSFLHSALEDVRGQVGGMITTLRRKNVIS